MMTLLNKCCECSHVNIDNRTKEVTCYAFGIEIDYIFGGCNSEEIYKERTGGDYVKSDE